MRYLILMLSLSTVACSSGPGAPLTDVSARSIDRTGDYDIVNREVQGKRYTLTVVAMRPDRSEAIAEQVVYQYLSFSPEEVVVEVRPHKGVPGETRRIRWVRGTDVLGSAVPPPIEGTSPSDRISNRPTGEPARLTDR
jgi:hypothetical protein